MIHLAVMVHLLEIIVMRSCHTCFRDFS